MIFPFTFKLSVPDIINPFSLSASQSKALVPTWPNHHATPTSTTASPAVARVQPRSLRHSPSISPPVIVSRKRAWEPALAEASQSTTTLINSKGYLEYRDMASRSSDIISEHYEIDTEELPPPSKRRRGLAGSIVSTALSAALIGTAVGLTVYRLWRDRGKVITSNQCTATEQPPPPPYQETERGSAPATPKSSRKHRSGAGHSKRSYHRQRSTRARAHIPPALTTTPLSPPTQSQFDFDSTRQPLTSTAVNPSHQEPTDEIDYQMDWFGDKLSALIAEGKRALGREIVVMSDSKEDEVDDGSGAWEDSSPISDWQNNVNPNLLRTPSNSSRIGLRRRAHTTANPSASSQRRRRQYRAVTPPTSASPCTPQQFYTTASISTLSMPVRHTYSASTTCLPSQVSQAQAPSTPRRTHTHGLSLDSSHGSGLPGVWTSGEDVSSYESPELRETMERARQRALMMRASKSMGGASMDQ